MVCRVSGHSAKLRLSYMLQLPNASSLPNPHLSRTHLKRSALLRAPAAAADLQLAPPESGHQATYCTSPEPGRPAPPRARLALSDSGGSGPGPDRGSPEPGRPDPHRPRLAPPDPGGPGPDRRSPELGRPAQLQQLPQHRRRRHQQVSRCYPVPFRSILEYSMATDFGCN